MVTNLSSTILAYSDVVRYMYSHFLNSVSELGYGELAASSGILFFHNSNSIRVGTYLGVESW
jgi:hypothetical protein